MDDIASDSSLRVESAAHFLPTVEPRPLKEEVLELIKPWRDSSEKPPFTNGELMVILLVIKDPGHYTLDTLYEDICWTFKYYGNRASRTCSLRAVYKASHDEDDYEYEDPLPNFGETVRDFDHPNCIGAIDEYSVTHVVEAIWEVGWRVVPAATRLYLRDKLESPRQGVFEFMGLPAELREKIYKMLLVYPKPGLTLDEDPRDWEKSRARLGVMSLTDVDQSDPLRREVSENDIAVESLTKTLAILGASKQIRHEALPIFYGNALTFGSFKYLLGALQKLSAEAIEHIKYLRIVMNIDDLKSTPLYALDKFLSHGTPKKLALSMSPSRDSWSHPVNSIEQLRFDDRALEGLIGLAKRAQQVEIEGEWFRGGWFMGEWFRKNIAEKVEGARGDEG